MGLSKEQFDFLVEDAAKTEAPSTGALERLHSLVKLYDEQAEAVAEAETALEVAKKAFNKTALEDIPELVLSTGLSELRLSDGRKLVVKEEISPSVKDATAFAAFVTERGEDDILKTTMQLGKLPENVIKALKRLLAEQLDLYPEITQSVHPMTLKKYIKEICGVGLEDPVARLGERYVPMCDLPNCVSVYRYYKTVIKNK